MVLCEPSHLKYQDIFYLYFTQTKLKASLMAKRPTLLEQFRSFYFQNNPKDMEQAINGLN